MNPAGKRFRPDDCSHLQIDLVLVVQLEFVPFKGVPQILIERLALYSVDVDVGLEVLIALAPVLLGLIHRGVRILEECIRILAVAGIEADANARCDVDLKVIDGMSFRERFQQPSCRIGDIFSLVYFLKQYHKFIASLPAYCVRGTYTINQPFCDGLKQFVADRMSQGIVDALEIIQIYKE